MSGLLPKLRFKEFSKQLNTYDLINLSENGLSNGVFNDSKKVGSGYKLINVKDMYVGEVIDINNLTLLDIDPSEFERNKVKYGDVFFTRSSIVPSGIAYSNVNLSYDDDITFDGHLMKLSPRKDIVIPSFLAATFKTWTLRKKFISRGKQSTMTTIGQSDIADIPIALPELQEQKKVADFLTSVDTKISQLIEKHRLLKDYRKGVIQQIFSQQIRFKDDDGNVLPEWSYKKLSKITSKVGSGSTPRGGQEAYTSNGVIFIRSQNVYDNKLDLRKIVFIPQSTHTKMKGSKVQKHDVLLNITGASIGRSCVVPKKFEEGNVNQHVCIIRTNNELDPYYLQFFLSSYLGQKNIFQSQAGGGREGLNFESIKLFKIPLPSVKEQQKIAQFLQSLDKKIDTVNEQIEQTKLFKKGLLQQMFV